MPLPAEVVLPPETGATFAENALIKARTAHEATGEPTIADDSGIAVAALGGRPGVHSARFAGPDATDEQNLDLLLTQVARHDDRSAAYVCVIAHIDADGAEQLFEGRCEGTLITEPRGNGRLRLRPGVRARSTPAPATSARWPSSAPTKSTRSATAAAPPGRSPRPSGPVTDRAGA